MDPVIAGFIAGFPDLMLHSGLTFLMLVAGVTIYIWLTPHREFALIKAGNSAAAVSLAGAIVGLAVPLAFSMAASVVLLEVLIWGLVTLLLQVIAFRIVDFFLTDLSQRIQDGQMSAAIFLVGVKLGVAAVIAAAVSG